MLGHRVQRHEGRRDQASAGRDVHDLRRFLVPASTGTSPGRRSRRRGCSRRRSGPNCSALSSCAEAFTPRLRYSGSSLGYQLASIIAGGPAPFISTWLFREYNSTVPIGLYVVVCAVISIAATFMLPDYTNREISTEAQYEGVAD